MCVVQIARSAYAAAEGAAQLETPQNLTPETLMLRARSLVAIHIHQADGIVHEQSAEAQDALRDLTHALALSESDAQLYCEQGKLLLLCGLKDCGSSDLQKAVELSNGRCGTPTTHAS